MDGHGEVDWTFVLERRRRLRSICEPWPIRPVPGGYKVKYNEFTYVLRREWVCEAEKQSTRRK